MIRVFFIDGVLVEVSDIYEEVFDKNVEVHLINGEDLDRNVEVNAQCVEVPLKI